MAEQIEIKNRPLEVKIQKDYQKPDRSDKYFKIIELVILTFTAFSFIYMSGVKGPLSLASLALLLIVILYSLYILLVVGDLLLGIGDKPKILTPAWLFYYGDRVAYALFALALIFMLAEITQIHIAIWNILSPLLNRV
ncbi:hypothetical protein HY992_02305 [Candidatus Micrarchaeota archaeon]|nr:hypothetical protein [Candidatus Micrarchaeota archaeon]